MTQRDAEGFGLKDRVCVVTGAGGGIGRAVALGMAEAGASVVLLDRDAGSCQATAEALRPTGVRTLALNCDIANPESVAATERASRAIVHTASIADSNAQPAHARAATAARPTATRQTTSQGRMSWSIR